MPTLSLMDAINYQDHLNLNIYIVFFRYFVFVTFKISVDGREFAADAGN